MEVVTGVCVGEWGGRCNGAVKEQQIRDGHGCVILLSFQQMLIFVSSNDQPNPRLPVHREDMYTCGYGQGWSCDDWWPLSGNNWWLVLPPSSISLPSGIRLMKKWMQGISAWWRGLRPKLSMTKEPSQMRPLAVPLSRVTYLLPCGVSWVSKRGFVVHICSMQSGCFWKCYNLK